MIKLYVYTNPVKNFLQEKLLILVNLLFVGIRIESQFTQIFTPGIKDRIRRVHSYLPIIIGVWYLNYGQIILLQQRFQQKMYLAILLVSNVPNELVVQWHWQVMPCIVPSLWTTFLDEKEKGIPEVNIMITFNVFIHLYLNEQ